MTTPSPVVSVPREAMKAAGWSVWSANVYGHFCWCWMAPGWVGGESHKRADWSEDQAWDNAAEHYDLVCRKAATLAAVPHHEEGAVESDAALAERLYVRAWDKAGKRPPVAWGDLSEAQRSAKIEALGDFRNAVGLGVYAHPAQQSSDVSRVVEALERIAALTPGAANAATAHDLHLTVKVIAEQALAQS